MPSPPPSSDIVTLDGLAGRKLVVTGGAGFIGSHLAGRLAALGADVHVVDDLSFGDARRVPDQATLHCLDIRDADSLRPAFDGADVVFHLAAIASVQISTSSPLLTHSVNTLGTVAVLEAARRAAVGRVVYASSSAVYGNQPSPSLSEDLTARPDNLYGLTKQEGELAAGLFCRIHGLQAVSLRYFNVYGPSQNPEGPYAAVIARFIEARRAGKPLEVVGDGLQTRDFVAVEDVVTANLAAATSPLVGDGEAVNIGTGRGTRILDIARMIGGDIRHVPERREVRHSAADVSRARELLGFSPRVELVEGLARLLSFTKASVPQAVR